MHWEKEANNKKITQITRPDVVLDFINKQPGLKEMCHLFPDILAVYAPQLTIKGFSGEFEKQFEEMLSTSIAKQNNDRLNQNISGTGLTVNKLQPACSLEVALRHPTFGNYISIDIACNFVQGKMGGPETQYYEIFEYIIWLLSSDSNWLPKEIHNFLLDGMKEWNVWISSYQQIQNYDRKFINSLYKAKSHKTHKLTEKTKHSLLQWVKHSLFILNLNDNPNIIMDKFFSYCFIEAYLKEKFKRK
ncbi:hypothetical protein HY745_02510 [Candidatus Desantisbacteria bacterium]|nr:hypothetical protein [Candidatus Desantisbacteria bacterium]